MATPIRIRRSAVPGKVPTVDQVQLGELAVNTYDGKAFLKKDVAGVETIVNIGGGYPGKTYFVTEEGLDTNDGESLSSAFATLKHALSVCVAGDTVELTSGTFTEIFPLTVPQGVTVRGKGLRSTTIEPTAGTERNDAFLLNGETTIEELSITNFYYNSSTDTGYGFRFAPGMVTSTRSPYVQRISVITRGSATSATDPYGFDTPDNYPTSKVAGRGAFVDGSVVSSATLEPAMLFNEVTFITPNQTALKMTNGARVEWVNCFTYFSSVSVDGSSGSVGLASTANASLKLSGISTTVTTNQVIKYYQGGSPVAIGTVVSVDGAYVTISGKGSGIFNSVGIGSTQDVRIFQSDGITQVGTASTILWADYQKFGADLRSIASASNFGIIGVRGNGVGVQLRLFGYNFGCVGSGKTFTQDPTLTVRANEAIQLNGGRVYYQSVDQEGNFRIGDIFEISQETGAVSLASTSNINVNGTATIQNLEVIGISTFQDPVEFDDNLYVAGISTFANNVAITGFTTVSSDTMLQSNLNVAGITTTATFRVTGISTLSGDVELGNNLRVAGVSTFNNPMMVNSNLNVTGITTTATFRVTGISTLMGDVEFNNNIKVSGIGTITNLRVTGFSTLSGDVNLTNNLNVLGITTTGNFRVTGVSTLTGDTNLSNNLNVLGITTTGNFRVTGISTLTGDTNFTNNVNVSGITTTSTFRVTGISTLTGDVELSNNLRVAGVSTFNNPMMVNSNLNVTGITTTATFRVTGISTLTGDVELTNNLRVSGIGTINNLRVTGLSTITGDSNFSNNLNVSGITTTATFRVTGISTLTGDTEFTNNIRVSGIGTINNLRVTGLSTFTGDSNFSNNLNVSGITTTGNFRVTGISTLTGDVELSNNLRVAGVSTLGITTFTGNVTFGRNAYFGDNDILNLGDGNDLQIFHDGSNSIIDDAGTGSLILRSDTSINLRKRAGDENQLVANPDGSIELYYDNSKKFETTGYGATVYGTLLAQTLGISGVSTFSSSTRINSDLNVTGITTTGNFRVTGISTLTGDTNFTNNVNVGGITTTSTFRVTGISTLSGDVQLSSNLNVAGVTTSGNLRVTGVTTLGGSALLNSNLYVSGITTLASPLFATSATLSDNVIINSNLTVAGNVTIGGTTIALTAQELKIKDKSIILGITTNALDADVSTDTSANYGGIAIASTEGSALVPLFVTGINTTPNTYKQLMWVKGNTMGAGTTDAWLSNYAVGIGSTLVPNGVRLSVGGIQLTDTNVTATKFIGRDGTISFLDGTNLYYSGIGSVTNFYANVGVVTHFTATNARVTGISTFANVQIGFGNTDLIVNGNARVTGILTVGGSSITLKGTTDEVLVGANTRIHTSGYDIGSSFVHSTGVELVNARLTGITTFTNTGNNIVQSNGTAALNRLTVIGISTFTGTLNAGNVVASTILVTGAGINTFAYLRVTNDANINNLYNVVGVVTTISGTDLTYTTGTITSSTSTYGNITGIITAVDVNVSSAATIDTLYSPNGTIDSLNSTTSTIDTAYVTDLYVTESYETQAIIYNASVSGIITATEVNVSSAATITNLVVTSGIITTFNSTTADITTGNFSILNVNSGIATQATITNANVTGILTAVDINVSSAATIGALSIGGTIGSNVGIFTDLQVKYLTATNTTTNIVSESITLGVSTDRVAITTTGVQIGDFVLSDIGGISLDTTVLDVLTGIVVLSSYSNNIFETNPTISIVRSNNIGIASISTLYVNSGFGTFFNITQGLIGIGTITKLISDGVEVSGITTTGTVRADVGFVTSLTGTNSYYVGVSTADTLYSTVGFVTTISGTDLNYVGIGSIATLRTNVGFVTFVSGTNLNYSGIGTIGTLNVTTLSAPSISGDRLTFTNGDINYAYISGVGTAVNLVSTVGFVTFLTGQNIRYTGVGTIASLSGVSIGYTAATLEYIGNINNVTSGISTIETLRVNSGIVTTLSGTRVTYSQADLTNTYTTGISSITTLRSNVGIVTFVSGTNLNYAGVGTINFLSGNNIAYTGIVTLGIVTALSITTQDFNLGGGALNFTGIATFQNLDSTNAKADYLRGINLNYSGIGTIGVLNTTIIQNSGFTTTGSLHVGVGGSLFSVVSGIGSVGIGTTNAREKLHVYGNIMYGDNTNTGTARVAITTTGNTTIHETLSRLEYRSVEYQIQASTSGVGATGRYQFTRILAVHDGTIAYNVEYANVGTGTDVSSYIIDIDEGLDAGYIRLQATPAQVGVTTFIINFVGFRI